jgi:uncharacterized protein (UPF0548 family)
MDCLLQHQQSLHWYFRTGAQQPSGLLNHTHNTTVHGINCNRITVATWTLRWKCELLNVLYSHDKQVIVYLPRGSLVFHCHAPRHVHQVVQHEYVCWPACTKRYVHLVTYTRGAFLKLVAQYVCPLSHHRFIMLAETLEQRRHKPKCHVRYSLWKCKHKCIYELFLHLCIV